MPLTSFEEVFWPRFADSVSQFIMASHPDRLTQSECFRQSTPETPLTCITCHDPHVPIEALGPDHYDAVCQSCHEGAAAQHTGPIEEGCVSCHMPVSGSSDIPHVRITDHFIRTPETVRTTVLTGEADRAEFVRMASLLSPSPTPKEIAQGYLTYYEEVTDHPGFLDSAAVYLRTAQAGSSLDEVAAALIRMHYLGGDYDAVVRVARSIDDADDAWTAYRIGDSFLETENPEAALRYLTQAVALAPANLRFGRRLASVYVHLGRTAEAKPILDRVLQANPKFAEAYSDRGFVHVLLRDFALAEADLLAALALSPDLEPAVANLASLYFNTGRQNEARPLVRRLLELDRTNLQYHQLWNLVR